MAKKVLIIEDDEQVARVYGIKLKQENIEIIKATDGEEGLEKMVSEKPSLVLLDLMLPKKDGFWVLEEMAKEPASKKIPVVILSNLGQEQDKERALKLGAKEYLVKADVSIKEVVEKIKKYLE
ncbi:MAG: response regulator [Candidatus Terrybacteria bacterium]|nr:response regulator [Candidatus Terrybacteria bacterium]